MGARSEARREAGRAHESEREEGIEGHDETRGKAAAQAFCCVCGGCVAVVAGAAAGTPGPATDEDTLANPSRDRSS